MWIGIYPVLLVFFGVGGRAANAPTPALNVEEDGKDAARGDDTFLQPEDGGKGDDAVSPLSMRGKKRNATQLMLSTGCQTCCHYGQCNGAFRNQLAGTCCPGATTCCPSFYGGRYYRCGYVPGRGYGCVAGSAPSPRPSPPPYYPPPPPPPSPYPYHPPSPSPSPYHHHHSSGGGGGIGLLGLLCCCGIPILICYGLFTTFAGGSKNNPQYAARQDNYGDYKPPYGQEYAQQGNTGRQGYSGTALAGAGLGGLVGGAVLGGLAAEAFDHMGNQNQTTGGNNFMTGDNGGSNFMGGNGGGNFMGGDNGGNQNFMGGDGGGNFMGGDGGGNLMGGDGGGNFMGGDGGGDFGGDGGGDFGGDGGGDF